MSLDSYMLNPKTSYTARIFAALLICSFIFISLVGFLSNYFYQNSLDKEISSRLNFTHQRTKKELEDILSFVEKSHSELASSMTVNEALKNKNWDLLGNTLSKYKLGSFSVYQRDGSFVNSFRRNVKGQFLEIDPKSPYAKKLEITIVERVISNNKYLFVSSDKNNVTISSFHEIKINDMNYISSVSLKVRNSFFEKVSKNLGVLFVLREIGSSPMLSFPLEVANFIGAGKIETGDLESFRGIYYSYKVSEFDKFNGLEFVSFVDVDSMVASIGSLHLRIFLVCILSFLLLSPILYYLAKYLSKPINSLNLRLEDFASQKNTTLLPVKSEDEFGAITKKMNLLFSKLNESSQEMEARVLENVVMNQKVSNLKKDFSRLTNDYLLSRIYRRYLDNLISEANFSQSVSTNANKVLGSVNELVSYLAQGEQHKAFVRKHNLEERLKELIASTENLSVHSLKVSENLIDHLWLMDKKDVDSTSLSIQVSRVIRLINGIFPRLKISVIEGMEEDYHFDKEVFITLCTLTLFQIGKQSRDGNDVKLSFKKVQDKKFQTYLSFVVQTEYPVCYEPAELDFEGQHLVKMIETSSSILQWPVIYPSKNRSKVEELKFQVELES